MLTAVAVWLERHVASGVRTSGRGRQVSTAIRCESALVVALDLLMGTAVVPHSLTLHALGVGASSVRASLHWAAQPLLSRAVALRMRQTHVSLWSTKLDFVPADDASLQCGNISLPERPHGCSCMLRGSSLLTVGERLIHFSLRRPLLYSLEFPVCKKRKEATGGS